jgi:hypothetical protein
VTDPVRVDGDPKDEPDWWLEAAFDDRTHLLDEDDPELEHEHWYDWEDDDLDDEDPDEKDLEFFATPSGFHSVDTLGQAPLQQKINEAIEELANQLKQGHTAHFRKVLAFYAKLHSYSLPNSLLIMLAKPDADAVAGYRRWQKLGRQVKRGAKSAQIWCPVSRKVTDEDTEEERYRVVGFRTGYVFSDKDLEDIETNPLPRDRPPLPDNHQDLLDHLLNKVRESGVTIREVERINAAHGYYSRSSHEIVLEAGKDSHNQSLILLHEWAHALFHRQAVDWPKSQKEFEAETVTMVMASILGLDTPYAGDYLLTFGATPAELHASLGRVHTMVGEMSRHLGIQRKRGDADD